ncbi:unnamed protein product [Didymodactylos carnosus]|uniref:Uncharacterized protein n=1 Tax=Didymodactylos carnosus TaxID=1234261 RepID=A0A816AZ52_9BILA|nr:unnamed protein product [Didymodactylos carnosus]CAF4483523.1 unnamed protein product [Didymodactylos carnosus]
MSVATIPLQWLIPTSISNGFLFRCPLTLKQLVKDDICSTYFRQLLKVVEIDYNIRDFHLELQQQSSLDLYIYYKDSKEKQGPHRTTVCISCDKTTELFSITLISEQQHTRAWFDGRNRPKLILTPIRHLHRLSEMTDKEFSSFWFDAVTLADREFGDEIWSSMIVNHGVYRTHEHLHLKINFDKRVWQKAVQNWSEERKDKIQEMQQLLEQKDIYEKCFGSKKTNKYGGKI